MAGSGIPTSSSPRQSRLPLRLPASKLAVDDQTFGNLFANPGISGLSEATRFLKDHRHLVAAQASSSRRCRVRSTLLTVQPDRSLFSRGNARQQAHDRKKPSSTCRSRILPTSVTISPAETEKADTINDRPRRRLRYARLPRSRTGACHLGFASRTAAHGFFGWTMPVFTPSRRRTAEGRRNWRVKRILDDIDVKLRRHRRQQHRMPADWVNTDSRAAEHRYAG